MKRFRTQTIAAVSAAMLTMVAAQSGAVDGSSPLIDTIPVSAEIAKACSLTATPLEFGIYNPADTTAHYSSSTITIGCVKGVAPVVTIGGGSNAGANGARNLKHETGTDLLSYELFKPSATVPGTACAKTENVVWGNDETTGFKPTSIALTGSIYYVCGKIDAGQSVSHGKYNDSVNVTMTF